MLIPPLASENFFPSLEMQLFQLYGAGVVVLRPLLDSLGTI